MTVVAIQRTPELIAAEINHIKDQTRTMFIYNSIEIGRKLCEVKQFITHGDWAKWLKANVDFSQSTANNLIRIFEEYGAEQMALFGETGAKSQALANLSYTQAVALLGVPAEEREAFIEEHDIDSMSTRELQQAIKERDQAKQQQKGLEEKLKATEKDAQDNKHHFETVNESYKRLEEVNHQHYEKAESLRKELEGIKKQLTEAQASGSAEDIEKLKADLQEADGLLTAANKEIEDLNKQLKEKPINVQAAQVIEKVPEEVEQELNELRKKAGTAKFATYFDVLVKGFNDLLRALAEIDDGEIRGKYKNAVKGLIGKMNEQL